MKSDFDPPPTMHTVVLCCYCQGTSRWTVQKYSKTWDSFCVELTLTATKPFWRYSYKMKIKIECNKNLWWPIIHHCFYFKNCFLYLVKFLGEKNVQIHTKMRLKVSISVSKTFLSLYWMHLRLHYSDIIYTKNGKEINMNIYLFSFSYWYKLK